MDGWMDGEDIHCSGASLAAASAAARGHVGLLSLSLPMAAPAIRLFLNGEAHTVANADPDMTLLQFIRSHGASTRPQLRCAARTVVSAAWH